MNKGEKTREAILEKAAEVFNINGFAGTSLATLMDATGLQKGGIYNHFVSKEALAVAAFDYAFRRASRRFLKFIQGAPTPLEKLLKIVTFFNDYFDNPPVRGGCVLLNTAVDSTDAHLLLRERARAGMNSWQDLTRRTVQHGIDQGQVRASVDADTLTSVIISTVEGALMLSELYDDPVYIRRAVAHLVEHIETAIKA